jgi:hypothetical protein
MATMGGWLGATEPSGTAVKAAPRVLTVELFDGIKQGRIEVRVVPKGASFCRVFITSKVDTPLNVVVPEAFAAVPVTTLVAVPAKVDPPAADAQAEESSPPGDDGAVQPGEDLPPDDDLPPPPEDEFPPKDPQPLGIGSASDERLASGSFILTPDRVVQLKVLSVCLDRGRPGPGPEFRYVVRPLSEVTGILGVYEICRMLGRGELSHRAAQAAAWHLANRLSWKELGAEPRRQYPGMGTQGAFTREELLDAKQAVEKAVHRSLNRLSSIQRPVPRS